MKSMATTTPELTNEMTNEVPPETTPETTPEEVTNEVTLQDLLNKTSYYNTTQFLRDFREIFKKTFPERTYVADLLLYFEASQCFVNKWKQVCIKPVAVRVRVEPRLSEYSSFTDFVIVEHKQLLTMMDGQPIIKFTENASRRKPTGKKKMYGLAIDHVMQTFKKDGRTIEYYPAETRECLDDRTIKWIRDRVVSNKPTIDMSLHL